MTFVDYLLQNITVLPLTASCHTKYMIQLEEQEMLKLGQTA
jgi:hypothetical protein